jgi:flagellar hook protein FlgE
MLRSLNSGVSGLQSFQEQMDVIGNNIANVNTTGFRAARASFADSFSQTLEQSISSPGGSASSTALQVGTGVTTAAIRTLTTQGSLAGTGVGTDLAINGNGYFVVRHPETGQTFATRAGDFRLDTEGYLITNTGHRVQGYSDAGLSTIGDLKLDATGKPTTAAADATLVSFAILSDGKIKVNLSDSTSFIRGQVLLQNFSDPQALVREGNNLFSGLANAGPLGGAASPTPAPPGTNGLGEIRAGYLELSNVDLVNEFSNLITTQRAFQAASRIITTSDEVLLEVVNLKR